MSGDADDAGRASRRPPRARPRGVATMSIVRWVLVAIDRARRRRLDPQLRGRPPRRREERSRPAQLYTCPMHPSVVQDHPGECPICSMTLVPKLRSERRPAPTATAAEPKPGVPGLAAVDLTPGAHPAHRHADGDGETRGRSAASCARWA